LKNNNTLKSILVFFYISLIIVPEYSFAQLSGNYTIGGTNPDFTIISDAVNELLTNGVSGPVIFNLRSGTYEENGGTERVLYIDQQITGVSESNTITFQPDASTGANVDNVILKRIVGLYDERGWIVEIRSDRIILNELTIEYADTSTAGYHPNTTFAPVHLQAGSGSSRISYVTISGCKILGTSSVQRSPQGISLLNEARGITITDNLIDKSKDGIVMSGASSRKRITISGNKILRLRTHTTAVGSWQGYGIQIWSGQDSIVVRNNIIDYRNGGYGVTAIDFPAYSENIFIEANQILYGQNDNWNQRSFTGIRVKTVYGQTSIINNMIASRSPGITFDLDAPDCRVYYNTVIQSSGLTFQESARLFNLRKSGNLVFNNIFIELCSGTQVGPVMEINDTT
jgi:hypothetical protein